MSGLSISPNKSRALASPKVSRHIQRAFRSSTGIQFYQFLDSYLGFLIIQGRMKRMHFDGLFNKILSKTTNWTMKFLSKAGKITLARSVLSAIPVCWMQNFKLPASVVSKIESTISRFILKDSTRKSIHLVSWKNMAKPKELGGLNLRHISTFNTALLGKLVWDFIHNSNKLWVKFLLDLYCSHQSF